MRRYERASTLLTSNRPVEELGQTAGRCRGRWFDAGPPAASRSCAQVRPQELAHQDRFDKLTAQIGTWLLGCEGAALALPGFNAFSPGFLDREASCIGDPPLRIPASESALRSHPCVAVSSAQVFTV